MIKAWILRTFFSAEVCALTDKADMDGFFAGFEAGVSHAEYELTK